MAHRNRPLFPSDAGPTNLYVVGLAVVLLVLLQATLAARIRVWGVSPNLILVAMICWSLLYSLTEGMLWGFVGGLLLDVIAGWPLGASALALTASISAAALGQTSVFQTHLSFSFLIVALATAIYGWVLLLIRQLSGMPVNWLDSTVHLIVPEIALNLLTVPLIYFALRSVMGRGVAVRTEA